MRRKILTFHPLVLPHRDGGSISPWCTYSEDDGMIYLLNGNRSELAYLGEIDIYKDIHFESEAECHRQADAYYDSWCRQYPHMAEWQACLTAVDLKADKESQTMEFI